jgi:hypothetical protein
MAVDSNGAIPVEAILKLIVDRSGSQTVEDVLKKQDTAFSKMEGTVGRISTGVEGIVKSVGELAGIAGVGALVTKFIQIETSASNIALAMGKVTGGSGAYSGIRQEELGVQSRTGVSYGEQEAALRSLAMSVGLNPRPGQAGMLAEVIAGYSRVTGISSSTLGSILGPMLQAEGRGSSASAAAYTIGEARANLGAFPGSQIEGVLPVVSNLATSSALGSAQGAGKGVSVGGIASLINTISGPGSVLRQPGLAQQAAEGIGGTLQGAYQNPRVYAFMKMAGVDFKEQQLGFNSPQVQEKIVREANRQYPGNSEEAWKQRRLLYLELGQGEAGADAFERIESATKAGGIHVATPQMKKEASERHHAQTLSTPEAKLKKLEGGAESWIFESPLHEGLAAGGLLGGTGLLGALGKKGLGALKGLFGAGEGAAGDAASAGSDLSAAAQAVKALVQGGGADAASGAGGGLALGGAALGLATAIPNGLFNTNPLGFLGLSNPTGGPLAGNAGGSHKQALINAGNLKAVQAVAAAAQKRFGASWRTPQAVKWMEHELHNERSSYSQDMRVPLGESTSRVHPNEATSLLHKALSASGSGGEGQQFSEAVKRFAEAVEKLTKIAQHGAAYTGGASYMGAPAVQAMQATVPGMVMAAFLSKGGSTTPMGASPATQMAAYNGGASGGWNAVLQKYSHGSYGLSHVEQLAGEHPGAGAHPGDRATVEADARKYGIPFNVLWGIYGAESSFGKAKSNFGLTGQYPGTGTSGNFGTDARTSAEDLAALAKQLQVVLNVNVGGAKVERHKIKVGAGSVTV